MWLYIAKQKKYSPLLFGTDKHTEAATVGVL